LLAVPAPDSHELARQQDLHEGVVRTTRVHLRFLHQRIVTLVKFKKLFTLLAPANVDLTVQLALQDGAEVPKCVLHVLNIDHSRGEIFEVMHDQLLLIGHEDSYPMLLGEQFKRSLRQLCLFLDLLKTAQIQTLSQFLQGLIKISRFLLYLIPQYLHLLLKTLNSVLLLHHLMIPFLFQGPGYLVHGRANTHIEIGNLVVEKCLE
jgi:hypothetical protein